MLDAEKMCGRGVMCQWEESTEKPARRAHGGRKLRWQKCGRRSGRRNPLLALRPANVQGMRAPRNTNQFLMREKYQMMHMRSDSVGTDSGSDCEVEPADMEQYLGVLENARGGLMDGSSSSSSFSFFSVEQDESLQYFPSEDDVMLSEDFMQKDFNQFCDAVAPSV